MVATMSSGLKSAFVLLIPAVWILLSFRGLLWTALYLLPFVLGGIYRGFDAYFGPNIIKGIRAWRQQEREIAERWNEALRQQLILEAFDSRSSADRWTSPDPLPSPLSAYRPGPRRPWRPSLVTADAIIPAADCPAPDPPEWSAEAQARALLGHVRRPARHVGHSAG
jgi:hypothetical protein